MSLDYYLFCREGYKEIISNLENIIQIYEAVNLNTYLEEDLLDKNHSQIFQSEINRNFFIQKLSHIKLLKKICDDKISKLCKHEFEHDSIDIDPDRSENITYCRICGFTK